MASPWRTSEWLNTAEPIDLEAQRGHVVVACAFQMLCPGCVSHAIPQMKAVHELFGPQGVGVVGLHTAFERSWTSFSSAPAWLEKIGAALPKLPDRQSLLRT